MRKLVGTPHTHTHTLPCLDRHGLLESVTIGTPARSPHRRTGRAHGRCRRWRRAGAARLRAKPREHIPPTHTHACSCRTRVTRTLARAPARPPACTHAHTHARTRTRTHRPSPSPAGVSNLWTLQRGDQVPARRRRLWLRKWGRLKGGTNRREAPGG